MIVVTAPTSNIGRQVLARIAGTGEEIRVIARDPSRLSPQTRDAVQVIQGSHREADTVAAAFEGADTVFWLVPADPRAETARAAYVDFARPGCAAFVTYGIKRVVSVSALGRGWPKDAGNVSATLEMDDMIAGTGVHLRALACAMFMDNVLRQLASIKNDGVIYGPTKEHLRMPTCATRDIAAVAARLLLDDSWTGVEEVPILGPEDLSFHDMASIMSEELNKPVRYQEISMDQQKDMMTARGASPGMAQAMVNMMTAANEGLNNQVRRTPSNSTGTRFRGWCADVLKPAVLA
jgi:uncharacterized protein YbjT (DUF2867 family)